jgi:protein involved in polysaccharide export with SLBB domain
MNLKFYIIIFLLISGVSFSQVDSNLFLGAPPKNTGGAIYDVSNPTGVNMEVSMWGFVRFPGKYIVPVYTKLMDLITYSGGPSDESNLEEIRIIRKNTETGNQSKIIKINYDDLMWGDNVSAKSLNNPVLEAGDVVIIMKQKRYTFREEISFYLPILTSLISIATFIITITKN